MYQSKFRNYLNVPILDNFMQEILNFDDYR